MVASKVIVGDRETIEYYSHIVDDYTVIMTRESIPDLSSGNIITLKARVPPTAKRGEAYSRVVRDLDRIAVMERPSLLVGEISGVEYSVLVPELISRLKPNISLVEVPRLGINEMAAIKELSLLSYEIPIILLHAGIAPRSRKLRRVITEAIETAQLGPGAYTVKLKRLKSYVRALLWYYEASDTASRAREKGVPEYLLLELEAKLSEASRLLKGSEFTIVYPSVYEIRQPAPDTLYNSAPALFPSGRVVPLESACYASIELVEGGLVVGCRSRDYLNEEAIFIWLAKMMPVPVWRRERIPERLRDTYRKYERSLEERGSASLHAKQPGELLEGLEVSWRITPLFSMDPEGLEDIIGVIAETLQPVVKVIELAASCRTEEECRAKARSPGLARSIEETLDNITLYKELARFYESIGRILSTRKWRYTPPLSLPELSPLEVQENIALLVWILQEEALINPVLADRLSLSSEDIADIYNILVSRQA